MVSCLILCHKTVTSLTKIMMLRATFHEDDFEIHVVGGNTVIIYLWNVEKTVILQAALVFETALITTGFGFATLKRDALSRAKRMLDDPQRYQQSYGLA
ncbi:hypothetical protein [Lentibacillus salinarum]|uniref:Uncharacterized protein n=1 Tax=Lentibacillus salinarum TaxID=446820 RepID=A0ABW3ZRB9_9BACI